MSNIQKHTSTLQLVNKKEAIKKDELVEDIDVFGRKIYRINIESQCLTGIMAAKSKNSNSSTNLAIALLFLETTKFKKLQTDSFRIRNCDKWEKISLSREKNGVFKFKINYENRPIECFVEATIDQLDRLLPELIDHYIQIKKDETELFYTNPFVQIFSTIKNVSVQVIERFLNKYAFTLGSLKNSVLEAYTSSVYKIRNGKIAQTWENFCTFLDLYGYNIGYDPFIKEVIIFNKQFSELSQLQLMTTLEDDLINEGLNENVLDKYLLRIAKQNPVSFLSYYLTDNKEQVSLDHTGNIQEEFLNNFKFDCEEDAQNFWEGITMLYADIIRKSLNTPYSLKDGDTENNDYFYCIVCDEQNDAQKLGENFLPKGFEKNLAVHTPSSLKKVLDDKKDARKGLIHHLINAHDLNYDEELTAYLSNAHKRSYEQESEYTVSAPTVLIGSMENGDELLFMNKKLIIIKFTSLLNDLSNVNTEQLLKYVYMQITSSYHYFSGDRASLHKHQERLQYENCKKGIYSLIAKLIGQYEEVQGDDNKSRYNPKAILDTLLGEKSSYNNSTGEKALAKALRKYKHINQIPATGFKISDSFFERNFEEHIEDVELL